MARGPARSKTADVPALYTSLFTSLSLPALYTSLFPSLSLPAVYSSICTTNV